MPIDFLHITRCLQNQKNLALPNPPNNIKALPKICFLRYQNHWPTASPTEQKIVAFFETTFVSLWHNFFTGLTSRFE